MSETIGGSLEYRGYTLTTVQYGSGWRVHIYPGPHILHTQPDHLFGSTKEDALARARAIVDLRFSN